jgi:hypothetical protein
MLRQQRCQPGRGRGQDVKATATSNAACGNHGVDDGLRAPRRARQRQPERWESRVRQLPAASRRLSARAAMA